MSWKREELLDKVWDVPSSSLGAVFRGAFRWTLNILGLESENFLLRRKTLPARSGEREVRTAS